MKLSDRKFISKSRKEKRAKRAAPQSPDGDDLGKLRGLFSREAEIELERSGFSSGASPEAVSFTHPGTGRQIYGWIVAVEPDGSARVELGEGEYALVPPSELKRVGKRENREEVRVALRKALSGLDAEANGVRADIHATSDPHPVGQDEDRLYLLSLAYAKGMGVPTQSDIERWVKRFHPTAQICEIDASFPGRVAVSVVEAEMDPEDAGDEVLEVLDPEEVKKEASDAARLLEGEHRRPFEDRTADLKWPLFQTSDADPGEIAQILAEKANQKTIAKLIKVFVDRGGDEAIAATKGAFNVEKLLKAALPVVRRVKPRLYQEVITRFSGPQEKIEQAPRTPKVPSSSPQSPQTPQTPPTPSSAGPPSLTQPGDPLHRMQVKTTVPNGPLETTRQQLQTQDKRQRIQDEFAQFEEQRALRNRMEPLTPETSGTSEKQVGPGGPTHVGPQKTQEVLDEDIVSSQPSHTPLSSEQEQLKQQLMDEAGVNESFFDSDRGKEFLERNTKKEGEQTMKKAKRAAIFERSTGRNEGEGTAESPSSLPQDRVAKPKTAPQMAKHNLPPALHEIFSGMKMLRMARRGDYIVARVEWDPKACGVMNDEMLKNTVQSFVKKMANDKGQGADFGFIGRVHVLALDKSAGHAQVQFASERAGPAGMEVVERGDD